MVNVHKIAEMGAYVHLLEYNKIEGMILLSELSRRRIRSVNKLIRVGKNEYAMVMRVDKEKGYIDLSKRRVSPEDIIKCEERYNKSKTVHSIMRHVAETKHLFLEDLNKAVTWPLYTKYGHAYDAFRQAIVDPSAVFATDKVDLKDADLKACLMKNIRRRLTPQPIKLRADVEVTCFSYEGIEAIKEALTTAIKTCSDDSAKIGIRLIAPPLYVITTTMLDKKLGVERLNEAIEVVRKVITGKGGNISVKMAPRATSNQEETDLALKMEQLEMENREVDGDADGD
jgi:translation initiation factor 2 subunit 1